MNLSKKRAESVRDKIKSRLVDLEKKPSFEIKSLGPGSGTKERYWRDRMAFVYLKYEEIILNQKGGIGRGQPQLTDEQKIKFVKENAGDPLVEEAFNFNIFTSYAGLALPIFESPTDPEKLLREWRLKAYDRYKRDRDYWDRKEFILFYFIFDHQYFIYIQGTIVITFIDNTP